MRNPSMALSAPSIAMSCWVTSTSLGATNVPYAATPASMASVRFSSLRFRARLFLIVSRAALQQRRRSPSALLHLLQVSLAARREVGVVEALVLRQRER